MPEYTKTTEEKLDEILSILKSIEARQIRTTALVETVKEDEEKHQAPEVGSFATGYQKEKE